MIIGIDGNEANVEKRVGVSIYALQLLRYFHSHASNALQFRVMLRDIPLPHLPTENQFFQYEVVGPPILWSQVALPIRLLKDQRMDVFFTPAHYAPRFSPIPTVVTVHDLAYFYYPDEFLKKDLHKLQNWTRYSIKHAKQVIAVSQQTKRDIVKFYHTPESKISVIYNGYGNLPQEYKQKITTDKNTQRNSKKNDRPYLLYVGTVQPRKNISTLLKAFEIFHASHKEFQLKIVGKRGWKFDTILQNIEQSPVKEAINVMGYVSDDKLANLYQEAFCYVLPSFYEGFGIPVLDAMSQRCPVIASETSSLPEVGGEAALYFDPLNVEDLVKQLELLITHPKTRDQQIKKGIERVKQFSWEQCAKETLQVLTEIKSK